MEEAFLKQKSRIKWLSEGDQNTSFFHHYVYAKQSREKIFSLACLDGTIVKCEDEVSHEILSFYKGQLVAADHGCAGGSPSTLKE